MGQWADFPEKTYDWSPDLPAAAIAWLEGRMTERLRRADLIVISTAGPQPYMGPRGYEWPA